MEIGRGMIFLERETIRMSLFPLKFSTSLSTYSVLKNDAQSCLPDHWTAC